MFRIREANLGDLNVIMKIEKESFIPQIQENIKVFENRINFFSEGFLIFEEVETKKIVGYFCTELWEKIPDSEKNFKVGHEISDCFCKNGSVLYISSFAIFKEFRGSGNGKKLFEDSLNYIQKKFEIKNIVLMVNELWKNAYKIYSENGFKEKFTIKNAFLTEDNKFSDGIVMIK